LPETNERDGQYQLELAESARCGRLAVTELLARVGGSSVTANCLGRPRRPPSRHGCGCWSSWSWWCWCLAWCGAGAADGAAPAARSRLALLLGPGRRLGGGADGSRPSGRSRPPALPGPADSGAQPGLGPPRAVRCWKAASFGFARRRRGRAGLAVAAASRCR